MINSESVCCGFCHRQTRNARFAVGSGENRFSQCLTALAGALVENLVQNACEKFSHGRVRISGINAATGLEAPVVFVVGIADLIPAESNYRLNDEARVELIRDNTRRIHTKYTAE